jgi:hypothetical protein
MVIFYISHIITKSNRNCVSVQTLSVGFTVQSYAQTILKVIEDRMEDIEVQKYAIVIFNNFAAQSTLLPNLLRECRSLTNFTFLFRQINC